MSGGNKPSHRHQRAFGSESGSLEVELKRFRREGEGKKNPFFLSQKEEKKTIRRLFMRVQNKMERNKYEF